MVEGALLYVEVPNALNYDAYQRLEFLYYFDRLHVNHFSPLSLARLMDATGFGYVKHFEYAFPYWDGGEYPALGMLFRKGGNAADLGSPNLLDRTNRYIVQEKERAKVVASQLDSFEGILVWGVGDNFYRSLENGGPLSGLRDMVLLDRRSQEITIGNRKYQTIDPRSGIRKHPWPVVVAISQGRNEISREVANIDPERRVIFV